MFRQLLVAALVGVALAAPSNKLASKNIVVNFKQGTEEVLNRVDRMRFESRGQKITFMKAQLEALAETSQKNALSILNEKAAKFDSVWISNQIFVENVSAEVVEALLALPEVAEVREQKIIFIEEPIPADNNTINAEWGVEKIEADAAWALPGGNNGQGVVVSNIDTGVRYTHQTLRANYRSSYGWFDPYTSTANPTDGNGHGTHTMGTIAGSNGIGVAPGAQWIACRGCSTSSCTENALTRCGQWVACPTLASGGSPNCNQAPDLVSNSWGGGQGDTWYNSVISAWHTAGIIPLFSQGNSGPACGTANSPGDATNVLGVGSTTSADGVSSFSSRGPTTRGNLKPDISAPGTNVRSAWYTSDTAYNTISGTSMACPHAAGATALLLAKNRSLTYAQVKNLLQNNADRSLGSATACGGTGSTTWPNNIYGYGRINARKALQATILGAY
ncbi:Bacillopeptidase F [Orchesella cincta]|uniref:Bacillopeptidase F n=1 Tax=Orchesella cincta TaxID=48709 RepID=A0A1D2NBF7_ORCCI|nr:Bacillopeptidase F [Orchesella cincta]